MKLSPRCLIGKRSRKLFFAMNGDSAGVQMASMGSFYSTVGILWFLTLKEWSEPSFVGTNFPDSSPIPIWFSFPERTTRGTWKGQGEEPYDLRPISLCNFVNKIFSRLLLDRISPLIPESSPRTNLGS